MNISPKQIILKRLVQHCQLAVLQSIHISRLHLRKNYYEILKLPRTCCDKDIRNAYINLSKEYHPDKNAQNAYTHSRFVELNEAYSVLSKPESRQLYDSDLTLNDSGYSVNRPRGYRPRDYTVNDVGDASSYESFHEYYHRAHMQGNRQPLKANPDTLKFGVYLMLFTLLGGVLQYYIISKSVKRRREAHRKQLADILTTMKHRRIDKE